MSDNNPTGAGNPADDPLAKLKELLCPYCLGTGYMELVMADLSREPWPCTYCAAGARVRDDRDANRQRPEGG